MSYKLTKYHHRKTYIKGDLESETIIDSVDVFTSKKAIVQYLEREADNAKRKGYNVELSTKTRGTMPILLVYTKVTWIHENTGEPENEYFSYRVS